MPITISIIVPVYNVCLYIEECMDSILAQDYGNLEVIFIDDCGTDDSVSKIEQFISLNSCSKWKIWHHEKNRGLSAARNTGIEAANGEYVFFLDSDDTIAPSCISLLAKPLETKSYDFVIGDYESSNGEASMLKLPTGGFDTNEDILRTYSEGKWYVMAWNKLCRKDFLTENSLLFKEGLIHEDVLWTFKVACKAKSMYVFNTPTYRYRIRESSIMTGMSIRKDAMTYVQVFDEISKFIVAENRQLGKYEYNLFEGKRCGIIYSLLYKKDKETFRQIYRLFYKQLYISPITAFSNRVIRLSGLLRDIHYKFHIPIGIIYKRMFFCVIYRILGTKLNGIIWK